MAYIQLLDAATGTNSPPVAVKATGSMTTVAKSALVDGETFTLADARGKSAVFVFDVDGTYIAAPGKWRVNVSAISTADEVRDAVIAAVNASPIDVTASSGGAATVTLTQDFVGPEGNTVITETVADGSFAVSGFSNGALSGVELGSMRYGRAEHDEGDATVMVNSTAGSGTMTVTLKAWVFSSISQNWMPLGANATAADKGKLNAASAIAETEADKIAHTEILHGVSAFDRIYLEIAAIGGTGTAISAWLASRRRT